MTKVHVCCGCGRTIDGGFIYCPWCGISCIKDKVPQSFDAVLKQSSALQDSANEDKIAKMHEQLDELEKELDSLVLSAEIHK